MSCNKINKDAADFFASPHPSRSQPRFANNPNLDMDDAMTGAATQEFQDVSWTSGADGLVATLDVNFLKFQKLSFLAICASGEDDGTISIRKVSLSGRA